MAEASEVVRTRRLEVVDERGAVPAAMAKNDPSPQRISAALEKHPDATAAELAEAAGVSKSTAAKVLGIMAARGWVRRTPGGSVGGRRAADRWSLIAGTVEETREAVVAANRERLAKSGLRALVLDHMRRHPYEAFSANAVASALGRSAAGVSNAMARLEAEGSVRRVGNRPRRYLIRP